MEKIIVNVPKGIRYISEWKEFGLPENPCIINKQITGCGFTEYCINGPENVILCSPRKVLLENKEEQHPNELLYVRNDLDKVLDIDKDLSSSRPEAKSASTNEAKSTNSENIIEEINRLHQQVLEYYMICQKRQVVCNLTVTYDSFRHVRDALGNDIKNFYIVVDEFQSIFTDSRFKSSTEMEFLNHLQDIQKLCFVSATPMMDKYLEMLDEFKDLPYIELDWGALDPGRIIKPQLSVRPCQSIVSVAVDVIKTYQSGNFQKFTYQDDQGVFQEIESKEVVIYVNSVKNICDIIRKAGLIYENTNILCARTSENEKKIRKAFNLGRGMSGIGSVPKKGETHKMFTLCTRTVYLGADFYSTCARSIILSDSNIDCLAVDITLDLPQILGRQRLLENPWKNRGELYFKTSLKLESSESFVNRINDKRKETANLLSIYEKGTSSEKHSLANTYQYVAKSKNYKDDYVSVNTRGGKDLFPVFNNLVLVSELRAFEIHQIDYKDRFSVFNALREEGNSFTDEVENFLKQFEEAPYFTDKMRLLCEFSFTDRNLEDALNCIPLTFKNYYLTLGPEKIRNMQYKNSMLNAEYERLKANQGNNRSLEEQIYSTFKVGDKLLRGYIKQELENIYNSCNIKSSPKATDLEQYFELKIINLTDPETGKRVKGYEILSIKKEL